MQAWAGVASFCMMLYLFSAQVLQGNWIASHIPLPTWVIVAAPVLFLVALGIIDMMWLLPLTNAYYTRNNHEWQEFREEQRREGEERGRS